MTGFNTLGVNQSSMSMDKYTGSLDHALANLHVGRRQGYDEGHDEGLADGYQQGFQQGRLQGWDDGVNAANAELLKADTYIKQHIRDKAALQSQVLMLNQQLGVLEQKIRELERQNSELRGGAKENGGTLLGLVDTLKRANLKLQKDLEAANNELKERTAQHNRQLWQYNRSVVFMHAVRGVLEDITSEKHHDAQRVKALFVEKYHQEVEKAVGVNKIKKAPHLDVAFESALPKTNQFIVQMLEAVNKEMVFENEKPKMEITSTWLLEESPSP